MTRKEALEALRQLVNFNRTDDRVISVPSWVVLKILETEPKFNV